MPARNIFENKIPYKWVNIIVKLKDDELPVLKQRLKLLVFETLGQLTKELINGTFPHVTEDKQITNLSDNADKSGLKSILERGYKSDFYTKANTQDMYNYYLNVRKFHKNTCRDLVSYFKRFRDVFFTQRVDEIRSCTPRVRVKKLFAFNLYQSLCENHAQNCLQQYLLGRIIEYMDMISNIVQILAIGLTLTILAFSVPETLAKFYLESSDNSTNFFPPFTYLQLGPVPSQSIVMYFVSANYSHNDQVVQIFNPHTRMNNFTNAYFEPVYTDAQMQPSFESYFLFNKLQEPIVPEVSNMSLEIAKIENSFVTHPTQIEIGQFIPLNEQKENYLSSYTIPSFVEPGYYLIQLAVHFPLHNISAQYINTIYIEQGSELTFEDVLLDNSLLDTFGNGNETTFSNDDFSLLDTFGNGNETTFSNDGLVPFNYTER